MLVGWEETGFLLKLWWGERYVTKKPGFSDLRDRSTNQETGFLLKLWWGERYVTKKPGFSDQPRSHLTNQARNTKKPGFYETVGGVIEII